MTGLKRDWIGSEFADFERALLFDSDKEHWGWFTWLKGGGNRVFTLSKSPFLDPMGDPVYYVFPEMYDQPYPSEGQFVQVNADGPPHIERYPKRFRSYGVKGITPLGDKELFEVLPKPRLYLDEFIHYTTINYDNAEKDFLHHILPLQVVSCPSNEIGNGGLTVFRDAFIDDKKEIRNFKKGILNMIPSGFKSFNPSYMYKALSTKDEERSVTSLLKKCSEVNLLVENKTSLMVNLPIIQHQSKYRFRQPLSSDVVSYQLSALICKPHIRKKDIKLLERSIIRVRKDLEKSRVDLKFKPFAEIKVAESLARLRLTQNNAIFKFLGEASRIIESQLKIQDELLDGIWEMQVEKFADLRYMYDGMELRDILVGGSKRSVRMDHFNSELTRRDIRIYLEIRKTAKETGNMEVPLSNLRSSLGIDDFGLYESLNTLRNYGYVLMFDNKSVVRLLDIGEFGDRFDEGFKK
ncbi:hypothetical protein CUJ83_12180 [Methanocella sp. CWC-04]|uniref:Uncharacterized protein n=1 Tax=Methanooceanicella nereidis TaxID=2052831 RepID=A0AAP2RGD4_9EURY|nr:hypothetical protein [Methanocella sp. CWC-04]MCD1295757.1 hypothetical protein [Methanocella sp. CWC-04]